MKYDIVIIGGGFAGASMAYRLSRLDSSLEIVLIERNELGGKPVSAFTFTDVIRELGIDKAVRRYYNQIEIISTYGPRESYKYDENVFALIDYRKTCEELVNSSGCSVLFKDVKSLKNGSVALKDEVLNAKIIVDASGQGYRFRKELNMDV
ncbi:MAG TPA: FAD-dependent oxidoreductase, partial [Candidatus Methanoperedens sp.]